jgi:hypothetical protein
VFGQWVITHIRQNFSGGKFRFQSEIGGSSRGQRSIKLDLKTRGDGTPTSISRRGNVVLNIREVHIPLLPLRKPEGKRG